MLTLELPSLDSLKGLDMDIGTTEIRLVLPGSAEYLQIPLPPELATISSFPTAKFSRKRHQLIVTWQSDSQPADALQTDAGERAQELASGISSPLESCDPAVAESCKIPHDKDLQAVATCTEPESDCLELVEDEVEHVLKQCTVKKLKSVAAIGGSSVLLSDFTVSGSATITKACCRFKVSISFRWEILDAFGGFLGATGTGDIVDFTQDQTSANVRVKASRGGSRQAQSASEWMKQHGAALIGECLVGEDVANTVVSDWKDMASEVTTEPKTPAGPPLEWAQTWLESKLSGLTVKLFGGSASASFSRVKISGDVSLSSKDGMPTSAFKLQVECAWTITSATGQIEGTLTVPEFTSGQRADAITVNVEAAPGKKASGQLLTALRQSGVAAVRSLLDRFASELQLQIS
jgi:hypothetical protein